MKHIFRTYHHSDWLRKDDCENCGVTRQRSVPDGKWRYARDYNPVCTPAQQIDMSPAQRVLAVKGDEI